MEKKYTSIAAACICIATAFFFIYSNYKKGITIPGATSFKIIDGREIKLEELRGGPVLITFWASTCATCIEEIPQLITLYDELHNQGLEIIGVAMPYDPPNKVLETVEIKKVTYPIALDIDGKLMTLFDNVVVTPTVFLISPDGEIVHKNQGKLPLKKVKDYILTFLNSTAPTSKQSFSET